MNVLLREMADWDPSGDDEPCRSQSNCESCPLDAPCRTWIASADRGKLVMPHRDSMGARKALSHRDSMGARKALHEGAKDLLARVEMEVALR